MRKLELDPAIFYIQFQSKLSRATRKEIEAEVKSEVINLAYDYNDCFDTERSMSQNPNTFINHYKEQKHQEQRSRNYKGINIAKYLIRKHSRPLMAKW